MFVCGANLISKPLDCVQSERKLLIRSDAREIIKLLNTYIHTHIWHTLAAEYVKKSLLLHNYNLIALNGRNVGQRILSSPLAKEMNRKFVQLALVTNKSRADIKKLIPIIVKIKVRFNFQLKNLL